MSDHELIALAKVDVAAAKRAIAAAARRDVGAAEAAVAAPADDEIEDDGFVTVHPRVDR